MAKNAIKYQSEAKIIAGTFVATGEARETSMGTVTPGTIQVQFGDDVITTRAERLLRWGDFIIDTAFGFKGRAKTGKVDYNITITHRPNEEDQNFAHDCDIGGGIRSGKIWYTGE